MNRRISLLIGLNLALLAQFFVVGKLIFGSSTTSIGDVAETNTVISNTPESVGSVEQRVELQHVRTSLTLSQTSSAKSATVKSAAIARPKLAKERIVLHTVAGDIVLALYPEVAPKTVAHMLKLAREGLFDSTHIGRVEPGFLLQILPALDRLQPLTSEQLQALKPVVGEFQTEWKHRKGHISMARNDDPNSAESSFSIMLGHAPHLDGKYALFGEVESGLDVVDILATVPRAEGSKPATRLTIHYAEVIPEHRLPEMVLEPARTVEQILARTPSRHLGWRVNQILQERCHQCHHAEKAKAELDLTSQASRQRVIKPGHPSKSELIRRLVADEAEQMPPEERLSSRDIRMLTAWVQDGAMIPSQNAADPSPMDELNRARAKNHWAFAPITPVKVPEIGDARQQLSVIDRFLIAKHGALPNEVDRPTLLRRLTYQLTGLPATQAEIAAFVHDPSPAAYNRQVERLLNSPHYGEAWARTWLDLVRYADSNGYENDEHRPHAYAYRDWVIRARNADLPFDRFIRWQIAGDELEPTNPDAVAATGFLAAGPLQTFAMSKRDRYDELDDIISTIGTAFLGMTIGCARCHDHKMEPISQRDYYRLQAVFASSKRTERILTADQGQAYEAALEPYRLAEKARHDYRELCLRELQAKLIEKLDATPEEKKLLLKPRDRSNAKQESLFRVYESRLFIPPEQIISKPEDKAEYQRLTQRMEQERAKRPAEPPKGLAISGSGITKAHFLERGDPNAERDVVTPGFPAALAYREWQSWLPIGSPTHPRTAMAHWLTDTTHGAGQLLARVIVNRLWQHYMGTGLVTNPNDFGLASDAPEHPELLDFLASELIRERWFIKPIERLILNSAAYRASRKPQRLTGEALRDSILAVAGNLNRQQFGPAIRPPMPPEAIFPTDIPKIGEPWDVKASSGPETWRRSIYVLVRRTNPFHFFQTFDAPDPTLSCGKRVTTTVPTQALILLNDPFIIEQCQHLALRVEFRSLGKNALRVTEAYRMILARSPTDAERQESERFLASTGGSRVADLCQVLLMSNEFAYID